MTTAKPQRPLTAGMALGQAVSTFLEQRLEQPTNRLLIHRYPLAVLGQACEYLIDTHSAPTGVAIGGRQLELALVLGDSTREQLPNHRGVTYGSGPDWPVRARDRGGLLVVLVPPDQYEFALHESIRSNTFLQFDTGGRMGSPRRLLDRMLASAQLDADETTLLQIVSRYMLARELRRRGDRGMVALLSRVERMIQTKSGAPTDLRLLALIPDDGLIPGLPRETVERRLDRNVDFQEDLGADLAQSPTRFFARRFPYEWQSGTADQLRRHAAKYDYDLDLANPVWLEDWPTDLTLDRLERQEEGQGARERVTVRNLGPRRSSETFERVPVVRDRDVEIVWDASGVNGVLSQPLRALVDGVEMPGVRAALADGTLQVGELELGRHTIELQPVDSHAIEVMGNTSCEVYVIQAGEVPFAVRGQAATGVTYWVTPGRPFVLTWGTAGTERPVSRWSLSWTSESGAEGEEPALAPAVREYRIEGLQERSDYSIAAYGAAGEVLGRATLTVSPVEVEDARGRPAGTVGQALVQAIGQLRGDSRLWQTVGPQTVRVALEDPTATDYWLRVRDAADDVVWEGRFAVATQNQTLLDRLERTFLNDPETPWLRTTPVGGVSARSESWPIALVADAQTLAWQRNLLDEVQEVSEFLRLRAKVFERLTAVCPERVGVVAGAALSEPELAREIEEYARAYERALSSTIRDTSVFRKYHAALALVDTVAFHRGTWRAPFAVASESTALLAVSPTHPLRLLWLLQFERTVRDAIERGGDGDVNPESFAGLSAMNYPPYLLDFELRFYRNVGVGRDRTWSYYLPEGLVEADASLSPFIERELGHRPAAEAVSVGHHELKKALQDYHAAHPYREALRFHYIRAGSGQKIVDALAELLKPIRRTARGVVPTVAETTAGRRRFHVNLLDPYENESEPPTGTGRAFLEYTGDEPDARLLARTLFAIQPVSWRRFVSGDELIARHHIVFGSGVFRSKGVAHSVSGRATRPSGWGLRNIPTKFIESGDVPQLNISPLVPEPPALAADAADDERRAHLLHSLLFAYQLMSSVSREQLVYSRNSARMQQIEIDARTERAIRRMHKIAEWVYIADAQIDVELFDHPSQADKYILDYRPSIGVGPQNPQHNYVITTEDESPIASMVVRFLQKEYGGLFESASSTRVSDAARLLLRSLNRVSGREILRVLGRPAAVKGVVGMGLTHTLFDHLGLLDPQLSEDTAITAMRFLVPVEDYFELWRSDAREVAGRQDKRRADLLDVHISLGAQMSVRIRPIEVKNVRASYSSAGILDPVGQVGATHELLSTVYVGPGGRTRRDAPIKLSELAQLLDFHLRRALMQWVGRSNLEERGALERAREFRRVVHEEIAGGRAAIEFGQPASSGTPLCGTVVHFAPDAGVPAFRFSVRASCDDIGDESIGLLGRYLRLGPRDLAALLEGRPLDDQANLRSALDGSPLPEPEPTLPQTSPAAAAPPRYASSTDRHAGNGQVTVPAQVGVDGRPSVPPEVRQRVQHAFADFVGNAHAVKRISVDLIRALLESPPRLPRNYLFTGQPSTGKTELARRVAAVLALPFVRLDGRAVASRSRLFELVISELRQSGSRPTPAGHQSGLPAFEYPPHVVFVDELHLVPRSVQESLLTMLEAADRTVMLSDHVAKVDKTTFLFATTRPSDVDAAFRSRCTEIALREYTQDEVAEVVARRFPDSGWAADIYKRIAQLGRCVPRVAIDLARDLDTWIAVAEDPTLTPAQHLDELRGAREIDELGLSVTDLQYLQALEAQGGRMGEQAVVRVLQTVDRDRIVDEVEPLLNRLGFIRFGPGGRELTDEGRRYLRASRRGPASTVAGG